MNREMYIVLPSNSSMNHHPENTTSHYTVKLPHEIELDEPYEVGLVEIMFPHSWYNIGEREASLFLRRDDWDDGEWSYYHIPAGNYHSMRMLVNALNFALTDYFKVKPDEVSFYQIKASRQIAFRKTPQIDLAFNPFLRELLGFTQHGELNSDTNNPRRSVEFKRSVSAVYVYLDIVESRIVGDTRVPLLACIPVTCKPGELCFLQRDKPRYIPIQKSVFNDLKISLVDDRGENIRFESGKSLLEIHLRPIRRR